MNENDREGPRGRDILDDLATYRRGSVWRGRDIYRILGYDSWDDFVAAVGRAKGACNAAGQLTNDHFTEMEGTVYPNFGDQLVPPELYMIRFDDIALSDYACRLLTKPKARL